MTKEEKEQKLLLERIGTRIKELRVEKGLTQQEFAAALDYEKSNASRLEAGKTNIRVVTLHKVAKALGITMSELLMIE